MRRRQIFWLLAAALIVGCGRNPAQRRDGTSSDRNESPAAKSDAEAHRVTPVQGLSWLKHLGLVVSETRLGQMGGVEPALLTPRREPVPGEGTLSGLRSVMRKYLSEFGSHPEQASRTLNEPFLLAGADLYRLNCQSCHGPDGKGAPPEINSLIEPVQGTSTFLINKRMQARGSPIGAELAQQLASQAEATLRERLQNGGKKMPPFRHLLGDEVEALIGYLQKLAGVPSPKYADLLVQESAARVGEHVIKGTCHICHDATGPGGGRMMMMRGIIPSLASIPKDHSLSSVQQQVRYGSSGMMGMMMAGERMPAYPYFTDEEVAAGYFFLAEYPPQP
jgi:mono/diheme cytochrome c family protein